MNDKKDANNRKGGRSKRAQVLVAAVEKATENFIIKGEEIARESHEYSSKMIEAVNEVRDAGHKMSEAARQFAEDPCSSAKRSQMVREARNLLNKVAGLLVLADMMDASNLLKSLEAVEQDLNNVAGSNSQEELQENYNRLQANAKNLIYHAAKRQNELKDLKLKDDLAAARAILKKNSMMLLTASKVYVRHPELSAAKENRDYTYKQMCEAVNTVRDVANGERQRGDWEYDVRGKLADALDDFDERIIMNPSEYDEDRTRPDLEKQLEEIISAVATMADSPSTRDSRRERIVAECNFVRQALQDLLTEYFSNIDKREPSDDLERAMGRITKKTRDLRRQLRKAVIDIISDSFFETHVPILVLIEAARRGDEAEIEIYQHKFREHANKLIEVADLACNMSNNEEGNRMVRYAAHQIAILCPQVINAAKVLAARPKSKVAQENMDAFKNLWESQIRILTEAVDDITTVDDFLAVSENHIFEDVNVCVTALQNKDADSLDKMAGAIRGRAGRVCTVVTAEMDNYDCGEYTDRVLLSVSKLRDSIMPEFVDKVEKAVDALGDHQADNNIDENEFIEAAHLVFNGVREIRRAVLLNRTIEEIDSELEMDYEENNYEYLSKSSVHSDLDEYPDVSGITNTREAYRLISAEEKQKIADQVEKFRTEKSRFDREVAKWDEKGNDIIVIAKKMCYVMIDMTEFTRGRGRLKTTMDVINKAKEISELGSTLDKLASTIAEQCPESTTKNDLLAYLKRIELYCQQLNITSKVKADVQNISGNLIVSGLDSATSLIQAAKNLMNAVVLTVKCSYVASTKYPRGVISQSPIVVWRMRAPEKKPLIRREKIEDAKGKIRKGSQKKNDSPLKTLNQFQSPAEPL